MYPGAGMNRDISGKSFSENEFSDQELSRYFISLRFGEIFDFVLAFSRRIC